MDPAKVYAVHEARRRARRRLPRMMFDFIDGGAEEERTRRRNEDGFADHQIWPKPLEGAGTPDTSVMLFGQRLNQPVMIGPTGLSGALWPSGEIAAAAAAHAAGTIWCMSHASTVPIEDVAKAATSGPLWFQVFIYRDRGLTESFIQRARDAGYKALVLTTDNQVLGQRERDLRNGFTIPPHPRLHNIADVALSLPWLLRHGFRLGSIRMANYDAAGFDGRIASLGARMGDMLDPAMSWSDVEWVRKVWDGPLLIKGILHPDEAERAISRGVDGVIVSNHGGRQLDDAPSSIEALPHVVDRVAGRIPVLHDGGVRRGKDVLKALALGARLCLIGRPHLWGLALAGEAGVARILEIYRSELERAMILAGCRTIADIDPELLTPGS
ncbi:MAG: alpha-hydroxy acid oxidase [Geminicoccaceae bacterium]